MQNLGIGPNPQKTFVDKTDEAIQAALKIKALKKDISNKDLQDLLNQVSLTDADLLLSTFENLFVHVFYIYTYPPVDSEVKNMFKEIYNNYIKEKG